MPISQAACYALVYNSASLWQDERSGPGKWEQAEGKRGMRWNDGDGGGLPPLEDDGHPGAASDAPAPTEGALGRYRLDARESGHLGDWQVPQQALDTQDLPPDYSPPPLPRLPAFDGGRKSSRRPLIVALCALLALAVVAGGVISVLARSGPTAHTTAPKPGCETGTPCQVANAFLAAYTGADYEAMYALTSAASRQRFSNPAILKSAYKDAHDYIVNRTNALVNEARVTSIAATPGKTTQTDSTTASVPVQIVMQSAWLGPLSQQVTLPLVREQGQWHVSWSPGLVFRQLDDPQNDPNYSRKLHLFAASGSRGTIYDRDGNVLAKDDTVFTVGVVPGQVKNPGAMLTTLSAALDLTPAQILSALQGAGASQFVSLRTVSPPLYTKIQNAVNGVAGVQVQTGTGRVYPYGMEAAAATGYVSVVTADDLNNDKSDYYGDGDFLGRTGVEAWGEQYLRPVKGGKLEIVEVNADGSFGQSDYTIAQKVAANGEDVHTAISLKTQLAAMAQLESYHGKAGGAVAVDPTTGEVLALASYPIYDPNDFSLGFTPNESARFNAMDHPYVNRALAGAYPTGSVFKVMTLAAALEHGISASQAFTCTGTYQVPGEDHLRLDDASQGHGTLTAPQALPPSCDVVFWKIGVILNSQDPTILPTVAKAFGMGAPTGIVGVPASAESAGLVPDPQWLQQNKNAQWSPSDAANLAIGQGFFQATPAQIAMLSAALGNNGVRVQPRLVTTVTASNGATVQAFGYQKVGTLPVSADNLSVIQSAMVAVTATPGGTANRDFKSFPILVAGKTGTAESGNGQAPHGWFTCYAPASPLSGPPVPPKIAVGAVVEYAGFGEQYAVPIGKRIIAAYLNVQG